MNPNQKKNIKTANFTEQKQEKPEKSKPGLNESINDQKQNSNHQNRSQLISSGDGALNLNKTQEDIHPFSCQQLELENPDDSQRQGQGQGQG